MKKLILFDWGNIVEAPCTDGWLNLFKACGFKENIMPSIHDYSLSSISTIDKFEEVYNQMARDFKFNTTFLEFVDLYKKIFSKIDCYEEVADYEKSLKDRCYIGILSNLTLFDKERLNKQVDLSKYDYVFLSFEMESRKPDSEIYEKVMEQISFDKKDILFIDDRLDNIESAKKIGWNTLQATGLELDKIKEKCEEFLND